MQRCSDNVTTICGSGRDNSAWTGCCHRFAAEYQGCIATVPADDFGGGGAVKAATRSHFKQDLGK